jgi:hypothetical protein
MAKDRIDRAERTTHRNGFRDRRWDTRLGTLSLKVPELREGGYVPSFIEHRKRSEQALVSVIQEAVVRGVSTRKIEAVLGELGIAGVSAGQVSQLCVALDERRCARTSGSSRWRPANEEGDILDARALPSRSWHLSLSRQYGGGAGQHAAPAIPAPESALGSLPSGALSSAQVLPEWTRSTPAMQ